jgi:hypothetical protein
MPVAIDIQYKKTIMTQKVTRKKMQVASPQRSTTDGPKYIDPRRNMHTASIQLGEERAG